MKLQDYEQTIDVYDSTTTELFAELDGMDPTSEDYEQVAKNLKLVQEAKSLEVRNMNEVRNNRVPSWATGLLGTGLAFLMGMTIYHGERNGEVIGSAATSLINKLKFH